MDYQRLSIYLVDPEAGLLTCAYQLGQGARRRRPGETWSLTGTGCELAISCGQGYIVEDNSQSGETGWPELSGSGNLRSALIVPIEYAGKVVGAVVPQCRWPNAYGRTEQGFLYRAATLLGPPIANSVLYSRLKRKAQEAALIRCLPEVIGRLEDSPDALKPLGNILGRLVEFDWLVIRVRRDGEQWLSRSLAADRWSGEDIPDLSRLTGAFGDGGQWFNHLARSVKSVLVADLAVSSREPHREELLGLGFRCCLHVPLRTKAGHIGVLSLYSRRQSAYDTSTRRMLEDMASHMAHVVQDLLLYRETQEHVRRMEALRSVRQALSANGGHLVVLDLVCRHLGALLDAPYVDIWAREGNRLMKKATWGHPAATESGQVAPLENVAGPQEQLPAPGTAGPEPGREHPSDLVLPLVEASHSLGVLAIGGPGEGRAFSSAQVRFAKAMAAQSTAALEKARLNEEGQRKARELAFLDDMARVLGSTQRLEEVFGHLAAAVIKLIPFDWATLSWIDSNGCDIGTLRWCADFGALGLVFNGENPFSIQTNLGFRNQSIGALTLWRTKGRAFTAQEREILERLGVQIAPVVQNMRLYQQARRQAYQLQQLHRIRQSPNVSPALPSPPQKVVERASRAAGASWAALYLYNEEELTFRLAARSTSSGDFSPERVSHELWELVERCHRTASPQRLSTSLEMPAALPDDGGAAGGTYSFLALALLATQRTSGVLALGRRGADGWTEAEVDGLQALANETAAATWVPRPAWDLDEDENPRPLDSLEKELLVDVAHALRTPPGRHQGV